MLRACCLVVNMRRQRIGDLRTRLSPCDTNIQSPTPFLRVIAVRDRQPIGGRGRLDVIHIAAIAAATAIAVLGVSPFERVRAGAGDRIGLALPIRGAADARLADAVDEEFHVIAAELGGDLPIEPDDPRP
jgi:hypothetical protein